MIAAIGLALAMQGPVTVSSTIDRAIVPVGDEVTVSLRAVTSQAGAFRAELPNVAGLELLERTERVDPALPPGSGRVYALDLRLRATQIGVWRYGPVLVFLGAEAEFAPEVTVTVVASAGAAANPAANPRLLALIRAAPPPRPVAEPTLAVLTSSAEVVRGEQLDVLTVAWFPRSVRARLRRPPTLKPPALSGVWSMPQPAIPGVLANVTAGDDVYDLFVSHQIVFPLAPGRLVIPPARVEYALPVSRRRGSGERPVEAVSPPASVTVHELPPASGTGPFSGPVASDLAIAYRVRQLPGRAGELLPVEVVVSGSGNLAFWPTPSVEWPPGTRAYLDGVDDDARRLSGRLGGSKTYRFLLLPDSAGSLGLPALEYPYFDPAARSYREATVPGMVVPILEATPGANRDLWPLATPRSDWARMAARVVPGEPVWWGGVLGVAALAGLALALRTRRREGRASGAPRPTGVEQLERMFLAVAPRSGDLTAPDVARELRRAGIDRELAGLLVQLQSDVDRARFAPEARRGEASLNQAALEAVRRVPWRVRRRFGLALGLSALVLAGPSRGQDASGRARYAEGDWRRAAEAFRAEAATDPASWQRWHNVAAAEYLAGRDAQAAAALTRALELAPRARSARTLWETLEREHAPLRDARPRLPVSPGERWLVALATALIALAIALVRPRARWLRVAPAVVAVLAALFALAPPSLTSRSWGFTTGAVTLRLSPHGLAPERGTVPGLSRVAVEHRSGAWALIRDHGGNRGWVRAASVAPVRRVD